MPRIRTIKPEFYRHHDLFLAEKESKLPIRVAFSGLWCCADKEGRFKWKPTPLKLDILPYDDLDFEEVLNCLLKWEFILKYIVDGKEYGLVLTFKEHQRITGSEKDYDSKLPAPQGNTSDFQSVSKETLNEKKTQLSNSLENQQLINGSASAFQNASKETLWISGKDNKERNIGKDNKERERNKDSENFIFWESEKKSFLNAGDWIFKFCVDKKIGVEIFDIRAAEFLSDLELKEDFKETSELKRHFTNWYNKKYNHNGTNGTKISTESERGVGAGTGTNTASKKYR